MRLSSNLVFACYSEACRPPTSGGTGGSNPGFHPHPGTRKVSSTLSYKNRPAEQRYGAIARSLDRLHGLPDDGYAIVSVATGTAKNKGGQFDPNPYARSSFKPKRGETQFTYDARIAELLANPRGPEIRVNNTGDGQEAFAFVHEFGHRTDFIVDPHERGGGRLVSMSLNKESPAVRDAFEELFTAANSDSFKASVAHYQDRSYRRYFASAVEVWARAYSQWASGKLGGDVREGWNRTVQKDRNQQWPSDEFDARLGPAVENVLIARGLMQRDN